MRETITFRTRMEQVARAGDGQWTVTFRALDGGAETRHTFQMDVYPYRRQLPRAMSGGR